MNKKIFPYGLLGSQVLKIKAAVLEIMERNGFSPTEDIGLETARGDGSQWQMTFVCKDTSLQTLNVIGAQLGKGFDIMLCWNKGGIAVTLVGADEKFMALAGIEKPQAAPETVPTETAAETAG